VLLRAHPQCDFMKNQFFFLLILILSFSAFPWGRVRHETVAFIASENLSPKTAAAINPLLVGQTLEQVSTWADEIKPRRRSTAPWHYINLPVRQSALVSDIPRYFANQGHTNDDNVVRQIELDISLLKSGHGSLQEREYALWFLIHFIGDLHMPLHIADDNDRGGNSKQVRFFSPTSRSNKGHVTNLHSLWDNLIEVKAAEDPSILGSRLNSTISPSRIKKWATGSIEDWSLESYTLAKSAIYPGMNSGADFSILNRSYYSQMRPLIDEQLEKAGIRLAFVLNNIFAP
jgi:hypothetical protein